MYAKRINIELTPEERKRRILLGAESGRLKYGSMKKEKNPNWKNGISNNNYHYKKIQKERYPEKNKARELVHRALKKNKIIKLPCEICGDSKSFAHHNDYSKPLEVIWLCKKHHNDIHQVLP
jgi:hypothetical protein